MSKPNGITRGFRVEIRHAVYTELLALFLLLVLRSSIDPFLGFVYVAMTRSASENAAIEGRVGRLVFVLSITCYARDDNCRMRISL